MSDTGTSVVISEGPGAPSPSLPPGRARPPGAPSPSACQTEIVFPWEPTTSHGSQPRPSALALRSESRPDWAMLPDAVRRDVTAWINRMHALPPDATVNAAVRELAREMRVSEVTARRKFKAFRTSGKWEDLVNRAKLPRGECSSLPEAFIEYWRKLCEEYQRSSKAAYRRLLALWRAGTAMPGYQEPPPPDINGIPRAWSYQNLLRYAPENFELVAARIGRSAAGKFRPLVFTTRAGLEVGEYYVFDDIEHDHKVNFLGVSTQAMRPLELCCLDLFSACKIAWGMKPTLVNDEGVKEKLKEREMKFLLAYVLTRIGYRPTGTTLIVEHGTATVRPELARILLDLTDGAVKVSMSGLEGAAAITGMYEGRSRGKSQFKAPLESLHSLTHNEMAALPGQMGKDRDHSPEELHGREAANNALLAAAAKLPPERAKFLKFPMMEFNIFVRIAEDIYYNMNHRDDHKLEGWIESGLIAHEFRLDQASAWLPAESLLQLPEHKQTALEPIINLPGNTRTRKMCPAEVWERGRSQLVRLNGQHVPEILGLDLGVERKVGKRGLIEFEDRSIGPGTFRYMAKLRAPGGHQSWLAPGETYLTYVNPFDPSELHVCRAGAGRGGYLGVCPQWQTVCRNDADALHRQMGAAAHAEKELLLPLNARHADQVDRRKADDAWNKQVLAGAPITIEEKAAARRIAGVKGSLSDIYGNRESDEENKEEKEESRFEEALEASAQLSQLF